MNKLFSLFFHPLRTTRTAQFSSLMSSKRSPHTPEQILAIQEARKLKKTNPAPPPPVDTDTNKGRIIKRDWISLRHTEDAKVLQRVKVLTWNVRVS